MPSELQASAAAGTVGSVFNQTEINKQFAYTFSFPVCPKECRLWTAGYLTVTFKALQGGPKDSGTSANDLIGVIVNQVTVAGQKIWPGAVATGEVKTITIAISASALTHGHLSFVVEGYPPLPPPDLPPT